METIRDWLGQYSYELDDFEGQEDWLVLPTTIGTPYGGGDNRGEELDKSNYKAALDLLGGESDTVHTSHAAGLDIIIVKPGSAAETIAVDIEDNLVNYPILDEEDWSERETAFYYEEWKDWGCSDFVKEALSWHEDELTEEQLEFLENEVDCMRWINIYEHYEPDAGVEIVDVERAAGKVKLKELKKLLPMHMLPREEWKDPRQRRIRFGGLEGVPKGSLRFYATCVDWPPEDVNVEGGLVDMIDEGKEVKRETFLKYMDKEDFEEIEEMMGYAKHPSQGLTMKSDRAVRYYKSKLHGRPVYYFVHSAVEHVFA